MPLLESVYKTTHVLCATVECYLLDTEECILQHVFGILHAQVAQVLHRRYADLAFENLAQPRRGEVHTFGQDIDRQLASERLVHDFNRFRYTRI